SGGRVGPMLTITGFFVFLIVGSVLGYAACLRWGALDLAGKQTLVATYIRVRYVLALLVGLAVLAIVLSLSLSGYTVRKFTLGAATLAAGLMAGVWLWDCRRRAARGVIVTGVAVLLAVSLPAYVVIEDNYGILNRLSRVSV